MLRTKDTGGNKVSYFNGKISFGIRLGTVWGAHRPGGVAVRGGGAPNEARHDRHNEQKRDRIVFFFFFALDEPFKSGN